MIRIFPPLAAAAIFAAFVFYAVPECLKREAHRQDVVRAVTCQQYPHEGC